jgi:hypothetical protein
VTARDGRPRLCWLHDNGDEHWCTDADLVGVIRTDIDGELRYDQPVLQAARSCAQALGQPERIIELGQVIAVGAVR